MKIKPPQLSNYLKNQGLSAIYVITGDEPLQMMECTDSIRDFARQQGFTERVVLNVEKGFDWTSINQQADSLSLFVKKRLLEIRLSDKSPPKTGGEILVKYTENLPADTVLLITADKLDGKKQKAKWFTALEKKGVVVQVKPIEISQLSGWVAQRMKKQGLNAPQEAMQIIAERSEGHLLACAQEIDKLKLLYGKGQITTAQVLESVADSARFEVFDWVDTVLSGNALRCVRQLRVFQSEGSELVLVAWALQQKIRTLSQVAHALKNGQSEGQAFKNYFVWNQHRALFSKTLKRHQKHSPKIWRQFLQHTTKIERIIKGMEKGNAWDELSRLSLQVAGVNILNAVENQ